MEEDHSVILISEGAIKSIKLSLSTGEEICTYSINECPVTHPSQLGNPFLGLPLEAGKCESCGASENDKCEGHFGYIELPVPIYHPCHVTELRQLLSLICLKCLRIKKGKDIPALSLKEIKTTDGAIRLELRAPHNKHMTERSWNFLDKYGFHHGGCSHHRTLLPEEALNILKKVPDDTRRKLAARGYIVQTGYVMKYLPVPPNCLYIPEFTDGQSIMSYDISIALLKKVLQKIEQIKRSRSGSPNFESHDAESCDLQLAIGQYIRLRGTTRGPQDNTKRFTVGSADSAALSTKQWDSTIIRLDLGKESVQDSFPDLVSSILREKGPKEALQFLNVLEPLLMEFLLLDGLSISLRDFNVPKALLEEAQKDIRNQSLILEQSREAMIRSSRGLSEPGTLFKNLMAILRDVVICYDGTVRNICSNSIIQLKYGEDDETDSSSVVPPGEPVGVLAATAISNPAYKAVLDSSQSNNASWESMKEILQTRTSYKNDVKDRKVVLFLNDCSCAKKFCKERAALAVQSCLKRVTLGDCATDICIEHQEQINLDGTSEAAPTLVGHIHLDKVYWLTGDPRIQAAKVIWVESDAASWVKHTRKVSKGESALEIIVEKDDAVSNGDAWRTAIDACLPVLNLIDTRRSIPYGIQQVRELIGISCAFDQVVQRLSTTVKMVNKGVLKDHLILVANSMTCTGNLIGFNIAGYKATFRSLKVQVPFTESTLFTPMKCFEKAAEKCDSDSLGCVVSSSAWGKHAAVGTGSSFQILWNENQLKSNKEYGDGLYDFLALVRTDQEKTDYMFLDDVDYLVEENAADDTCLSPEPDGTLGKPTFEDNFEEQNIQKGSSWEIGITTNSSWEQNASAVNDSGDWGGWSSGGGAAAKPADQDNSWEVHAKVQDNSTTDWGGWSVEKPTGEATVSGEPAETDTWADKGAKMESDAGDGNWEKSSTLEASKKNDPSENTWDKRKGDGGDGAWGNRSDDGHGNWEHPSNWNGQSLDVDQDTWGNARGKKKADGNYCQWEEQPSNYKQKKTNADHDSSYNNVMPSSEIAWNAGEGTGRPNAKSNAESSWGEEDKMESDDHPKVPKESDTWNTGRSNESPWDNTDAPQDSWVKSAARNNNTQDGSWDKVVSMKDLDSLQDSWSKATIQTNDAQNDSWDNVAKNAPDSAAEDSWGAATPAETTDSGNKEWKSDGWGAKSGNWSSQRNNPGRPPRRPDERGPPPPRQRFELTVAEKNILLEVEPIKLRVRSIFREACDGVRLNPEDEKFILEKVLEHHPEKQSKVSGEIDYLTVNKHQTFQDTRCFFVVSTDGSQADFSYLKCLENFVRKSYTEDADTFCMKYLRPRRRQAPPADVGTASGAPDEVPPSTAAETEQGTPPAPQAEVPQETWGSPAVPLEGGTHIAGPDSTGDAVILGEQHDLTPASPAVAPQVASEPDTTDGTGLLGKAPQADWGPRFDAD
ncbi:DNA-directed RNA polymerase V subunit 1 [Zea mays]|uniref:DNA-directed RNA polymerase n=1 Tax=Zea mays TaxID=4577 RepID=A0A3L6F445_MAIZE|nr:DNA-directed RNA polymerase V subunit 1 [Zea mays]